MENSRKEASIFAGFDRHKDLVEARTIFEAAPADNTALADYAETQLRSLAMALVLSWLEQGDYSYAAIEAAAAAMADLDENEEIDDEEELYLNDLLQAVADALIDAGATTKNVVSFMDDEDDEEGAKIGEFLSAKVQDTTTPDEEIIANYATSGDAIFEATIKVVKNGVVTLKKKRIGRAKKMSSLQRAALKKARSRAFTGAAKLARKKSLKIRKKRGM